MAPTAERRDELHDFGEQVGLGLKMGGDLRVFVFDPRVEGLDGGAASC